MPLYKCASVLTISVIFSYLVACPAASLLHPGSNRASSRIEYEKSTRQLTGNEQEHFLPKPISQVSGFNKRVDALDFALTLFEPGELLIPPQVVAEVLESFYSALAANSRGPWADIAERTWIRITHGALGLLMTATEGTTIPWDFVARFALDMLRHTERGYTGTYTANFVDPTLGSAIWVSFYYCALGPLTDPAAVGALAEVASCLNPKAQAWFPAKGKPTR